MRRLLFAVCWLRLIGAAAPAAAQDIQERTIRFGLLDNREQSVLLRMVLNMKAARAIGIQVPDSIRLRADTLIQ